MKKLMRFVSLLLSFLLLFSLAACNKSCNNEEEVGGGNGLEFTGKYIVENSTSDYKILIPAGCSSDVLFAASELQSIFEEATSIKLPIVEDTISINDGKFLSLGNTQLFKSSGLEAKYSELKRSGLKMVTKDDDVLLFGATDKGTLYAVYTFLHEYLNWEFYFEDFYDLDKNVTELKLYNYNLTEIPSYDIRYATLSPVVGSTSFMNRYRQEHFYYHEVLKLADGTTPGPDGVLVKNYLLPEIYKEDHPLWFAQAGQICFNAQGNPAEREALIETMAEILQECFMNDPVGQEVRFGGSDNEACCNCTTCQQKANEYGANSGSFIAFLNDVREKVDAWMAGDGAEYAREWRLEGLFYMAYIAPPVKNTSDGMVATIKCANGVYPFYAPINADWAVSVEHPDNKTYYDYAEGWNLCSDGAALWFYGVSYDQYLAPYDAYLSMQETLKYMENLNPYAIFIDGYGITEKYGGWHMMKYYIYSKLFWDIDCDIEALIDGWCNCVYGKAGTQMKNIFNEVRVNFVSMREAGLKGHRPIYRDILKEEFFTKSTLLRWIDMYNQAISIAEKGGESEKVIQMIIAERASPLYLLVQIYGSSMAEEDLAMYKAMMWSDFEAVGILHLKTGVTIEDIK